MKHDAENSKWTEETLMKVLDWAYDKAINGIPGINTAGIPGMEAAGALGIATAEELAKEYLKQGVTLEERVDALILWQVAKCATSGFVTGLGGLITLPVALPANIASVLYVQLRMIAAIAYMGGYDPKDDKVKTFAYICLTGSGALDIIKKEILKAVELNLGKQASAQLIRKISAKMIKDINKAVGVKLFANLSEKGIANLLKLIPILSGLVFAMLDASVTHTIGKTAKTIFISGDIATLKNFEKNEGRK